MNREIRDQLAAALRSGKYTQTYGTLRARNEENTGFNYCCLGVLCDLHSKEMQGTWYNNCSYAAQDSVPCGGFPPLSVLHWAGLPADKEIVRHLAQMNDEEVSFSKIADYIEENL